MRGVVVGGQGVGHGVVDAQADVGEAHAGDVLAESHALAAGAGLTDLASATESRRFSPISLMASKWNMSESPSALGGSPRWRGSGASMPVEAVRPAGMEAIMSGSTTATSGASLVSTHTNLRTFSGSGASRSRS